MSRFVAVSLLTFAMFMVLCIISAALIAVIKLLYQHVHLAARGTLALQVGFIDSRRSSSRFNDSRA